MIILFGIRDSLNPNDLANATLYIQKADIMNIVVQISQTEDGFIIILQKVLKSQLLMADLKSSIEIKVVQILILKEINLTLTYFTFS